MMVRARTVRIASLATAGLLATTALTACGGDDGEAEGEPKNAAAEQSPAQVVQATGEKTEQAGSARLKLTTTAVTDGRSESVSGSGVIDLRNGTSEVRLGMKGEELEQRVVDRVLYQKPPEGSGQLPKGKSWTKVDLGKLQSSGAMGNTQVSNPADSLAYTRSLSEENVEKVGTEKIGGVRTTHYRVDVDLGKLAEGNAEQERKLRQRLGDEVPVDLWIDDEGLMRRQQVSLTVKDASGQGSGRKATVKTVMNLSGFGTPVDVSAPPAGDTADMTDELAKAGSGSA
ncbi:putative lipoprotein [Streptomyces minutiscleroticus]|uniref:Lipoprotein n=1 Tax=Streptomyces minutiscleroticus TaxID=68238 RepID=A0A918NRF9_9ACTN|nr:LppX_LprAFG lipoprotein [Streptomyces minutiscleroticus]GGX89828.1 putative lipoprotein [Streptomyces minutiscleroticus]